jgi:hypothetical protein
VTSIYSQGRRYLRHRQVECVMKYKRDALVGWQKLERPIQSVTLSEDGRSVKERDDASLIERA